ncbi:putative transmembrane protein [Toxoplasma gondii TgCatPRC2]|uniref:Transmembrane protein n=7 Tax=Toxoplasma gondii TaxID=5811 RepID=S7WG33_TOXGG|nr:hypothetical protein TGGT1_251520 [Toxoplasma gondii GT1]KAF4638829.1 hypothetical protein TGRH88_064380 [Toxoplasma gondii]KFG40837.1 putative transmembrane protein [Toxoplasma gondii GAB2-2007-GAL-DOM2]KFG46471.1 putative transmembrane protein [Toxoplasma gondii FOU]KYK62964.1 putative transmembrane protein [Toxoplasma gondii TgCatPRC2]PIL97158.1 putative transmembrane protein [Toxoplasma gondii COUG]RQX70478.1 putative transmembrane protein [Toxoplasma gondii CAST]
MEKYLSASARRSKLDKRKEGQPGGLGTPGMTRCCSVRSDTSPRSTKKPGACVEPEPPCEKTGLASSVRRRIRLVTAFYLHCHEYKWGRRRSRTIGLSSAFYMLPALALFPVCRWEACLWAVTAVFSFSADYIFAGMRDNAWICGVHMADRYVATAMLGVQCLYNLPLWFTKDIHLGALGLSLIVVSCAFKVLGSRTKVYRRHAVYHSLWHVFGSVGRVLVAVLEYPELSAMW